MGLFKRFVPDTYNPIDYLLIVGGLALEEFGANGWRFEPTGDIKTKSQGSTGKVTYSDMINVTHTLTVELSHLSKYNTFLNSEYVLSRDGILPLLLKNRKNLIDVVTGQAALMHEPTIGGGAASVDKVWTFDCSNILVIY